MVEINKALCFLDKKGVRMYSCMSIHQLGELLAEYETSLDEGKDRAKIELEQAVEVFSRFKYDKFIKGIIDLMSKRGFHISEGEISSMLKSMNEGKSTNEIILAHGKYLPSRSNIVTLRSDFEISLSDHLFRGVDPNKILDITLNELAYELAKNLINSKLMSLDFNETHDSINVTALLRVAETPKMDFERFTVQLLKSLKDA